MANITSKIRLRSMFFRHWNGEGHEIGVLVVKGTLRIVEGKKAVLLDEQPDFLLADIFHGEANISSLYQESDLAPFKPRTDVTFHACARSPEQKRLESWPVHVRVGKVCSHSFHVFGARHWEPVRGLTGRRWTLSPVEPMTSLPLTYDYAFGGTAKTGENDQTTYPFNPLGRGLLSDFLLRQGTTVEAPQIGLAAEFASIAPGREMTVCGCGPLTKSWLPRLVLAGTFDNAWKAERHPRMPVDHNPGFWNAAPLPLQITPWLRGNESIEVTGLRHDPRPYVFALPDAAIIATILRDNCADLLQHRLNLDTVRCDIADPDPDKHTMTLTWRLQFDEPDTIREIQLGAVEADIQISTATRITPTVSSESAHSIRAAQREAQSRRDKEDAIILQQDEQVKTSALDRGWNETLIAEALKTPPLLVSVYEGGNAVRYEHPDIKASIVVESGTGRMLHAGRPGYRYRSPDLDPAVSSESLPTLDRRAAPVPAIDETGTVMIRLMNENIDVWRPVVVRRLDPVIYCLLPDQRQLSDERQLFNYTAYVECALQRFDDGVHLTVMKLHNSHGWR